jgi:hypothetical protein
MDNMYISQCKECKGICSTVDTVVVREPPEEDGPNTEIFCSMSCMENYYFPDHKEQDVEIANLKETLEARESTITSMGALDKQLVERISELKLMNVEKAAKIVDLMETCRLLREKLKSEETKRQEDEG